MGGAKSKVSAFPLCSTQLHISSRVNQLWNICAGLFFLVPQFKKLSEFTLAFLKTENWESKSVNEPNAHQILAYTESGQTPAHQAIWHRVRLAGWGGGVHYEWCQ